MKSLIKVNGIDFFSFHKVTEDNIRNKISKLDGSKVVPVADIPVERLKSAIYVHASLLIKIIYSSLRNGCFLDELKAADVTSIFNKYDDLDKENYRPFRVLNHVSKVFKRIMYIQIESFMEDKLLKLQISGKIIVPNIV